MYFPAWQYIIANSLEHHTTDKHIPLLSHFDKTNKVAVLMISLFVNKATLSMCIMMIKALLTTLNLTIEASPSCFAVQATCLIDIY